MNASQVKWASEHDWYRGWGFSTPRNAQDPVGYVVLVADIVVVEPGVTSVTTRMFTSFKSLKAWAGY